MTRRETRDRPCPAVINAGWWVNTLAQNARVGLS